jgi:hypothetical protein
MQTHQTHVAWTPFYPSIINSKHVQKKMALQGNVERQKPALHPKKKLRVKKPSYKKRGHTAFNAVI